MSQSMEQASECTMCPSTAINHFKTKLTPVTEPLDGRTLVVVSANNGAVLKAQMSLLSHGVRDQRLAEGRPVPELAPAIRMTILSSLSRTASYARQRRCTAGLCV